MGHLKPYLIVQRMRFYLASIIIMCCIFFESNAETKTYLVEKEEDVNGNETVRGVTKVADYGWSSEENDSYETVELRSHEDSPEPPETSEDSWKERTTTRSWRTRPRPSPSRRKTTT